MKPLQAIGLGLIWVVLNTPEARFDWFPDPIGWLIVLYGVHKLPSALDRRATIVALAWLAAAVSVPLTVPDVVDWFRDADPSLAWAATLPSLAFVALLCHSLARAATESGAQSWLRIGVTACAVTAVAPVFVFGAGWNWVEPVAGVAALVALILPMWLSFSYAGREWAGGPPPAPADVGQAGE